MQCRRRDDDADEKWNCKAGTVVDRGVTSVYWHDFFAQPHSALQGTVRPTHYTMLHDDNNISADVIQKLVNDFSYVYARATRVRIFLRLFSYSQCR